MTEVESSSRFSVEPDPLDALERLDSDIPEIDGATLGVFEDFAREPGLLASPGLKSGSALAEVAEPVRRLGEASMIGNEVAACRNALVADLPIPEPGIDELA